MYDVDVWCWCTVLRSQCETFSANSKIFQGFISQIVGKQSANSIKDSPPTTSIEDTLIRRLRWIERQSHRSVYFNVIIQQHQQAIWISTSSHLLSLPLILVLPLSPSVCLSCPISSFYLSMSSIWSSTWITIHSLGPSKVCFLLEGISQAGPTELAEMWMSDHSYHICAYHRLRMRTCART